MLDLKKDVKDIKRFEHILATFFEQGLGYYVKKIKLQHHLPFHKRIIPVSQVSNVQLQAQYLRQTFEKLGPTFVKFGQLLSLRPDLLPNESLEELKKLQDKVPGFEFSEVKRIIEEDFNQPLEKIFKSFDKKALSSASMAQVHKAELKDGKKVAVKVLRPNIKEVIDADLDILFYLAKSLEKHLPSSRVYQPVNLVKEFAYWTRKELNFRIEANNILRMQNNLVNNKNVIIPKVYQKYSSKRVLTMEYLQGIKLDDLNAIKQAKINRSKLALLYFNSIIEQALFYGFFHADPHPGNVFVHKNGKLIYLDFGIVGELNIKDREIIINFFKSISDKDPDKSIDIFLSLAREIKNNDLSEFKKEAREMLNDVYESTIQERSGAKTLYELISLGAKNGIVFDPNHILMAKSAYQGEGLALKLNPKFKVKDGLEQFFTNYLEKNLSPKKIISGVKVALKDQEKLWKELPQHILKIINKLEKDEPPQQINIGQLHQLEHEFELINKRRNLGIILTLFILGSALFFYLQGQTQIFGMSLGLILLIVAIILFFYLILFNKHKCEVD